MRSKLSVLWFTGCLMLGLLSVSSVSASALGEWAWQIPATNEALTVEWASGDGSVVCALTNGSKYIDLFDSSDLATKSITFTPATLSTPAKAYANSDNVALPNGTFTFAFKFSSDPYSTAYTWDYIYNTAKTKVVGYTLTNADDTMTVSLYTTSPAPSAVPIPGSALLLGSSLLGLVGISTRKKKA